MNNTTASNSNLALDISLIAFGSLSLVSNFFLFATILFAKHKIDNFRRNALMLAAAEFADAFYAVAVALYRRIIISYSLRSCSQLCAILQLVMVFCGVSIPSQGFCMSLDRLFATSHPLFYHNKLKSGNLLYLNIFMWLISLTTAIIGGFVGIESNSEGSICSAPSLFSERFYNSVLNLITTFVVLELLAYLMVLLVTTVKKLHHSSHPWDIEQQSVNRVILKAVGCVSLAHFCLWVLPFAALRVQIGSHLIMVANMQTSFICSVLTHGIITFGIYLWTVADVRRDFLALIRYKPTLVSAEARMVWIADNRR